MIDREPPMDAPIIPQDWIGGIKVVDIGDIRVARGLARRPVLKCHHHQLTYDETERRVWCHDCETTIESFDAFLSLVWQFNRAQSDFEARERLLKEAEAHRINRVAAKIMDDHWRTKHSIPTCPHCNNGLLPDDAKRMGRASRVLEERRRKKQASD